MDLRKQKKNNFAKKTQRGRIAPFKKSPFLRCGDLLTLERGELSNMVQQKKVQLFIPISKKTCCSCHNFLPKCLKSLSESSWIESTITASFLLLLRFGNVERSNGDFHRLQLPFCFHLIGFEREKSTQLNWEPMIYGYRRTFARTNDLHIFICNDLAACFAGKTKAIISSHSLLKGALLLWKFKIINNDHVKKSCRSHNSLKLAF